LQQLQPLQQELEKIGTNKEDNKFDEE